MSQSCRRIIIFVFVLIVLGTHLSHKTSDAIKVVPCTAFRIEPKGSEGIITIDGERVEYGPLQGEVMHTMINVIVP